MDKITYLAELAEGLARWVPERERMDILRYYAEYFDEAGPDREAEVVAELGDPWALSSRLAVEGGYVTWEKAASWTPRKRWPKALLGSAVGLTIFALVFGIGLLAVNVTRAAGSHVLTEFGQAYVVDDPAVWGEFGLASIDEHDGFGYYLMDGEFVDAFSSIDADISLGNIQVVAGDSYALSIRRSGALSGPVWEVRNGVLKLRDGSGSPQVEADSWDDLKGWFDMSRWAVDVTVTVPQNIVLDRISVKTGLGNVSLWGLNAAAVTVETGMGNVECYAARSVRRLDLSTGLGNVEVVLEEALNGLDIDLESGKGNIGATLCGFETDYSYTLESGMGCVTVNGGYQNTKVVRMGNQPYRLTAESGMGDVNVYFTFG